MFLFNVVKALLLGQVPMRMRNPRVGRAFVVASCGLLALSATPYEGKRALTSKEMVEDAIVDSAMASNYRVEVKRIRLRKKKSCKVDAAVVRTPVSVSQTVTVVLQGTRRGRPCQGTAQANVKVFEDIAFVERDVERGQPVLPSIGYREVERKGRVAGLRQVSENAVASRPLRAGTKLKTSHLTPGGPKPGAPVEVAIVAGGLSVSTQGTAVRCRRQGGLADFDTGCVRLASGRVVQGRLHGRQVVVGGAR